MVTQSVEPLNYDDRRKTSSSSKGLLCFLGILCVGLLAATIALAVLYAQKPSASAEPATPAPPSGDTQAETCETEVCVQAAARILSYMDPTQEPCDDFYKYACARWEENHIIAADQSSVSTFNDLRDALSTVLKNELEKPDDKKSSSITKAKDMYWSCMNISLIESRGMEPVLQMITDLGGWPVVDGSTPTLPLEEMLAVARSKYGTNAVLGAGVSTDLKDSLANIFQFDQPSLGIGSRDYYLEQELIDKTIDPYKQFMVDFMTLIAGGISGGDTSNISTVAEQIVAMETELARSMAPDSERRDDQAIYLKLTLNDLSAWNGNFDWLKYVTKSMEVAADPPAVDKTEDVVIYAADYLQNFTNIILGKEELVQNYLVWRVLKNRISYMSKDLRETATAYNAAVSGTTAEEARYKTCSDEANNNFPMPVGSLYVQAVFPEENKETTEIMVQNIRASFNELLDENEWMDEETKQEARTKEKAIQPFIAYPDYIVAEPPTQMDQEYQAANIDRELFFENVQQMLEFDSSTSYGQLRKAVDKNKWITGPAIVNAFYSPSRNQIVFPAGILQPPFYGLGQPNSMNYGGIGMVIGHEITHGFDDSGSQYDENGDLMNWWTNKSRDGFNEKADCMTQQYSAQTWDAAGGRNLDGKLTLGENIADNGGLRQAYRAYKKWQQENPEGDLKLPGLASFTQDQLFFLGNAQVWCSKYTEARAIQLLKTDPHSPGEFRVKIPDSNFEEFGKAFGCSVGEDEMYPPAEDTCRVW